MKKWFKKHVLSLARRIRNWYEQQVLSENERQFRRTMRELRERQKALKKLEQNECPHIAGSSVFSEEQDVRRRTSIVWHRLDTGETFGLCTNCGKQFWPKDVDYEVWRKKPCFNKMSAAGLVREHLLPSYFSEPKSDPVLESQTLLTGYVPGREKQSWIESLASLPIEEEERLWRAVHRHREKGIKSFDDVPLVSLSGAISETSDPWLLNPDGTPDSFYSTVMFNIPDFWQEKEAENEQATQL
jgi:hypothetical protein